MFASPAGKITISPACRRTAGSGTVHGLGPAGALGDDMEADYAVRGAHHLLADLVRAGALGRERRAGVDVEEDRTGQADSQQDVGQHVHRAPPGPPATFSGRPSRSPLSRGRSGKTGGGPSILSGRPGSLVSSHVLPIGSPLTEVPMLDTRSHDPAGSTDPKRR